MNEEPTPIVYENQEEIKAACSSGDADFKDAFFKCDANFSLLPFNGKADFSGAVFKGHADFTNFEFRGKVDFTGARFEEGASFMGAVFRTKSQDVLFDEVVFQSSQNNVTFENAQFNNFPGNVSFNCCRFENGGSVNFFNVKFGNGGDVNFSSASFCKGWDVNFGSTSFKNEGDVYFDGVVFSNGGVVDFGHADFRNRGVVRFGSTSFINGGIVWFNSVKFDNTEFIDFRSAIFGNGDDVCFVFARFKNEGATFFQKMIWANSGGLDWKQVEFKETAAVKFDECLFLPGGRISFEEVRFPKDGSLMFQRCYFARTRKIDFTGTFFRHTTFEGGIISWLKDQKDRALNAILEERLGGKFEDLPWEAKDRIGKLNKEIPESSNVFKEDVEVLWKDLTTESAKNLTFRLTNLSGSIFDGMTPSHIQLNAPEWAKKDERNVLYEDLQSKGEERSPEQLRNIEDQYTQLKNNLERQGNYLHAGDFHYGEQEIRRERVKMERLGLRVSFLKFYEYFLPFFINSYMKKKNGLQFINGLKDVFLILFINFPEFYRTGEEEWRKLWNQFKDEFKKFSILLLAFFYRLLSGYGERPERAIIMFFLLLFGFSVMVFPFNDWQFFQTLADLITPFSWRKGNLESHHFLLIPFQLFLLGIQLPIMILAIRRRFKR